MFALFTASDSAPRETSGHSLSHSVTQHPPSPSKATAPPAKPHFGSSRPPPPKSHSDFALAPHAERNHFGSAWPLPSQSHSDSARSPHQTMLGCSVVFPVPLPGFRRQLRQATLCEDQETPHPSPRKVTTAPPHPSEAALWHSTAPHHQSHSVTSPWTRSPSKKKPALCPLRGVCARI